MSMIDGNAFLDWLERYCKDCDRRKGIKNGKYRTLYDIGDAPCRACDRFDVICEIEDRNNQTTIDAETVKHGKWIEQEDGSGWCSLCGCSIPMFIIDWQYQYDKTPYCPSCGAKMDGCSGVDGERRESKDENSETD